MNLFCCLHIRLCRTLPINMYECSAFLFACDLVCVWITINFFFQFLPKLTLAQLSLCLPLQLVCFYYVLTTFTTVGYGEFVVRGKMILTPLQILPVRKRTLIYCTNRWYLCPYQRRAGEILSEAKRKLGCDVECDYPGILYWPFPLCSIALWDHHSTSEWDSVATHYAKKGPGKYISILRVFEAQVFTLIFFSLLPLRTFCLVDPPFSTQIHTRLTFLILNYWFCRLDTKTMFKIREWERFQFSIEYQHHQVGQCLY